MPNLPSTSRDSSPKGTLESQYSFADKNNRHNHLQLPTPGGGDDTEYAEISEPSYTAVNKSNGYDADSRRGSNASRIMSWGSSTMYLALYDYEAKKSDEISLQKNDHIQVSSSCESESGWLRGLNKRTNRSGLLPENYVQIM